MLKVHELLDTELSKELDEFIATARRTMAETIDEGPARADHQTINSRPVSRSGACGSSRRTAEKGMSDCRRHPGFQ